MLSLPNLPDEDVAAGGKEQNVPDHYFKEKPVFDFEAKNHVDLCESLGLIDYQRGEMCIRDRGGKVRKVCAYRLPDGDERRVILIQRVAPLNRLYPRPAAKIKKEPLL